MSAITPLHPAGERTGLLSDLADEINREHDELKAQVSSMVARPRHIGELLERARAQLGQQGRWLEWLRLQCPSISVRSAQNYTRVSKYFAAHPDQVGDLSLLTFRGVLAAIAAPQCATGSVFDPAELPTSPTLTAEPVGPVEINHLRPPKLLNIHWPARKRPIETVEPEIIERKRRVEVVEVEIVEPPTRRIAYVPAPITIEDALKILRPIKNCKPLARYRAQQRIVEKLRRDLERAEARLAKVGASVIEAARAKRSS
jgi:hypothetical protein